MSTVDWVRSARFAAFAPRHPRSSPLTMKTRHSTARHPRLPLQARRRCDLLSDVRDLILQARDRIAQAVNASLTLLYWRIGTRIRQDVLHGRRADYGEEIFHTLSARLQIEFGRGFSERNLSNMVRFAEVFPDAEILHTLCAKLSWSHFRQIIYLDDPLKRDFYGEMCRIERWSVRTLEDKIGYWTKILPKKLLEQKLQDTVQFARTRAEPQCPALKTVTKPGPKQKRP